MRILGIDLGSKSIKAVELDSAFGRYEIHEYHELPFETPQTVSEGGTEVSDLLKKLLLSLHRRPDKIVMALSSRAVTFRNLQLPIRDKKAIQSTLAFELEDELPFPSEQTIYDYNVLSQAKTGTRLHVAATLRQHVAKFLNTVGVGLSEDFVDPDLVTTESWAYRGLLNRILSSSDQESPVLLAQIGHSRTLLYVHWRGEPIFTRELTWGGRDITAAIGRKYQITLDQAEDAKKDHGSVISASLRSEATAEQLEFSDTVIESLRPLMLEIQQVEMVCRNTTNHKLSLMYLAGGTSLLPGLQRVFEDELGIQIRPLQSLSGIATSGVTYSEQTDASFSLAVSLALCLVGNERASLINFRKGTFAKQGASHEYSWSSLKFPVICLGIVAFCMFVSLGVQNMIFKSRLKAVDSRLETSVKSYFGQISTSAVRSYLLNTESLKKSVNKELSKQRDIARLFSANPRSPLDFLKDISNGIPKDLVLDTVEYQMGSASVSAYAPDAQSTAILTLMVANPQSIDRLNSILGSKINDLHMEKSEVSNPDGTKHWKVTFSGILPGQSKGGSHGK